MKRDSLPTTGKAQAEWYSEEQRYHDDIAGRYAESHRDILLWQMPEKRYLFDAISSYAGQVVLDVGCGPATSPTKFLRNSGCHYIGVDISLELLRYAARNFPEGLFVRANAVRLPLQSRAADIVLSLGFLHHLPEPYDYLTELARVHSRRGPLLLREPSIRAFRRGQGMSPNEQGLDETRFFARLAELGYRPANLVYLDCRLINGLRRVIRRLGLEQIENRKSFMSLKIAADLWLDHTWGRTIPYWFHGLDFYSVVAPTDPVLTGREHLDRANPWRNILACPTCHGDLDLLVALARCAACGATFEREANLVLL